MLARLFAAALLLTLALAGCASHGPTALLVPTGRYAETFDAAKEELIRRGFTLRLVDARGGVIASAPVSTAGLATPWTKTEASFAGEVESFLHHDQRRVTIRFAPVEASPDGSDRQGVDRRAVAGSMVARVVATRERLYRPGFRLSPVGVRLSSVHGEGASEPAPSVVVRDVGEDAALSASIAARLARELGLERIKGSTSEADDGDG